LAGSVIVRQRGTKVLPGLNVGRGKDDTLFARINGTVTFEWAYKDKKRVSVYQNAVIRRSASRTCRSPSFRINHEFHRQSPCFHAAGDGGDAASLSCAKNTWNSRS